MGIIRIEMKCPHCDKAWELSITAINRPMACPFCSRAFVAEPYKEAAQLRLEAQHLFGVQPESPPFPETRYLRMICAVYKKEFVTVYTRDRAGEIFRLKEIEKLYDDRRSIGVDAAPSAPEKFVEGDFGDADITCPWCGSHPHRAHCRCETYFCGGTGSPGRSRESAGFHTCPACGRRQEYFFNRSPNDVVWGTSHQHQSGQVPNASSALTIPRHTGPASHLPGPVQKLLNAWKR